MLLSFKNERHYDIFDEHISINFSISKKLASLSKFVIEAILKNFHVG
jgi:hypothetical protein